MKERIHEREVPEAKRAFETLATALESGSLAALVALAQGTAFSRRSRVERTCLRTVLESFSEGACAFEIRFQTGLSGSLLCICRVPDLIRLGKLLAGGGGNTGETLSPELMESCVHFFAASAQESNRLLSATDNQIHSDAPELLNPDGDTASLEPLNPHYEDVLCADFRVGIESVLDCPFRLMADRRLLESLIALLPGSTADSIAFDDAGPQASAPGRQQETRLAQRPPEVEMNSSKPARQASDKPPGNWNIDLLLDVELPVAVSFGECEMPLKDVLRLAAGSVIELDKSVNDPVTIIVNEKPIAKGEVVMIDGNYGVRITEVESTADRIRSLA